MAAAARPARAVPQRTCVGCRDRAPATDLLRVVAVDGRLVPDPRRRLPGRGAHLHHDPECLRLATRRRALPRALRVPGPLDDAELGRRLAAGRVPAAAPPPDPAQAGRDGDEPAMSTSSR